MRWARSRCNHREIRSGLAPWNCSAPAPDQLCARRRPGSARITPARLRSCPPVGPTRQAWAGAGHHQLREAEVRPDRVVLALVGIARLRAVAELLARTSAGQELVARVPSG